MMNNSTEIILQSLQTPVTDSEIWLERLAKAVNELIANDFPALVHILYRVDVNEAKLKQMLAVHPDENAGYTIARMLLQRQIQKEETKKMFAAQATKNNEEERW
jgi:hypothetical protein